MSRITLFISAAMILVSCAGSNDRIEARNRDVVRTVFSEIWSKGNVDLIPELFSEDYIGHFPAETVHGREGLAAQVVAHRTAFPDWTEEVEDLIADGDRIAVRFTSRGTNLGDFFGNPPTGNTVEITEAVVFKFMNGKISEQWVYPDILSLQRQLMPKEQR